LSNKNKKTKRVTDEEIIKDVKALSKEVGKDITRAEYAKSGKYGMHTVNNKFGSWSGLMSRMGLTVTKEVKTILKAITKHSKMDGYRSFYKDKVVPWGGKYEKPDKKKGIAKILVASDFHDEEVDEFSLAVLIDTARRWQPDVICLNGDVFDCYEFSRYNKDPRRCDTTRKFQFVHDEILKPLREACPKAQMDLIIGNHEYRLLKQLSESSPHLRALMSDFMGLSLKDFFGLDKYKVNLICKSDLATWTKGDAKMEMKKNFKVYYNAWVAAHECDFRFKLSGSSAHTHNPKQLGRAGFETERAAFGPISWMVTPGMVVQDADYVERLTGAECGFGQVYIDIKTKAVQQKLMITSGPFCEVGGKMYYRDSK